LDGGTERDVLNQRPVKLGKQMYVLKDMPGLSAGDLSGTANPDVNPTDTQIADWRQKDLAVRKALGGKLSGTDINFYVEFNPTGYMVVGGSGSDRVRYALTIVRADPNLAGTDGVIAYTVFALNPNTGTALIFE